MSSVIGFSGQVEVSQLHLNRQSGGHPQLHPIGNSISTTNADTTVFSPEIARARRLLHATRLERSAPLAVKIMMSASLRSNIDRKVDHL
jgi:hypothetical protein